MIRLVYVTTIVDSHCYKHEDNERTGSFWFSGISNPPRSILVVFSSKKENVWLAVDKFLDETHVYMYSEKPNVSDMFPECWEPAEHGWFLEVPGVDPSEIITPTRAGIEVFNGDTGERIEI